MYHKAIESWMKNPSDFNIAAKRWDTKYPAYDNPFCDMDDQLRACLVDHRHEEEVKQFLPNDKLDKMAEEHEAQPLRQLYVEEKCKYCNGTGLCSVWGSCTHCHQHDLDRTTLLALFCHVRHLYTEEAARCPQAFPRAYTDI